MKPQFLASIRMMRVGLHLLQGVLTVAVLYPCVNQKIRWMLKRRWSQQLLNVLGVELVGSLPEHHGAEMRVVNHISWLDVFALNALEATSFVAKADVRHWPVIGWLCARADTLFLERGSSHAARRACADIRGKLLSGQSVVVFPEGTTSLGDRVLPFKSALLQGALDATTPVRPLAIRYRDGAGNPSEAAAYVGDDQLITTMWRIASCDRLIVEVHALPTLSTVGAQRREIAAMAAAHIAKALCLPQADMHEPLCCGLLEAQPDSV